jgi:glycosyltransferase involved in cell wall biosynthesis
MGETVTVVIPTCNRPSLLVRALESVLCQTFQDFEVIVVIDGPDLKTIEALSQFADSRLRYVELSTRVGGSEARNIGAREARGRWIALLDDDDEWLPAKLEQQVAVAKSVKGASALVTSTYICRAQGVPDVIRPRRLPRRDEDLSEFMFDYLCYLQTSTFLCTKELFLRVPFDQSLAFFQDIDWYHRLSREPEFELVIVPEPLAIYYMPTSRVGITATTDWRSRVRWGQARQSEMSRRSYSNFIVGTCVGRAVEDGAGWEGFKTLFHEAVIVGSATPFLVALLCVGYLLPPAPRKRLRDMLFFAKANGLNKDPSGRGR